MPRIDIIGYGITPATDLSLGSFNLLKAADKVLTVASTSCVRDFLAQNQILIEDVSHLYVDGRLWEENYHAIAGSVLSAALSCKSLCYLTGGHPCILDEPCRLIVTTAKEAGIPVVIHPGISFIDAILAHLQVQVHTSGFRMIDATSMVAREAPLDTLCPLIIAQVGSFQQAAPKGCAERHPDDYTPFIAHLLRSYPPSHIVTVFETDPRTMEPIVLCVCISQLAALAPYFSYNTSFYVPPVTSSLQKVIA